MPDRLHVLVDAQPFSVEVRPDLIVVDADEAAAVRITSLGAGRYRIAGAGSTFDAIGAVSGDRIWIAIDGETFECRISAQSPTAASGSSAGGLSSPMPATVTAIPVSVGQTVDAGDVLIALEAMKMELPLRAPLRGVVSAVHCRVGDIVQPDVVLVEVAVGPVGSS